VINKFYLLCVIFSGSPDLTLKTCLVHRAILCQSICFIFSTHWFIIRETSRGEICTMCLQLHWKAL